MNEPYMLHRMGRSKKYLGMKFLLQFSRVYFVFDEMLFYLFVIFFFFFFFFVVVFFMFNIFEPLSGV